MYHKITNFKLSDQLKDQIDHIDWRLLHTAIVFGKKEFLYSSYSKNFLFDGFKYYGWALQHIGTVASYELPNKLELDIRREIKQQLNELLENHVVIRLQIVYGGSIAPIHTDKTRNSSIVYPISHPHKSLTEFYEYNGPESAGYVSPQHCKLVQQVSISDVPVLLNTKIPHAVRYDAGTYTKKDPRVSLTLKFEKLDFWSVMELIK
jgi:hypothetical protein